MRITTFLPFTALLFATMATAATIDDPAVVRSAPGTLSLTWVDADPVDIFQADDPAAPLDRMKLISKGDRDGRHSVAIGEGERAYFVLRDTKSGETRRVAERVLPLQQGSNFRDLGGYQATGGKHVRWGLIYRSGGQPMLTESDLGQIRALHLSHQVDLRSSEERVLAPSRIEDVPYQAVGYSMASMFKGTAPQNGQAVYQDFPTKFAPQLRLIFRDLLADDGAMVYNCSAGQDRTGFATAMILSALGVPRDVIIADYHLSTPSRRPQWEMPKIDPAAHANDPVALFFARYQQAPGAMKAQPLKTADGKAFLSFTFEEIDRKWGSVDAYLAEELGLTQFDIARLRQRYLE